jgi:phosphatidylglycerol---prolipoprotein diacylglyceryl transferase
VILEAIQFPNIDPAALTIPGFNLGDTEIGPFHLRWYALAYIVGLVLGWRWMVWLIRRDKLWAPGRPALSVPQADDFLFWATLGVILGGRLGYVLFYKPDMIWRNFMEIFQIWQGGMSFHGGLIGVALAAWWFTRQKHVNEEQYAKLAAKHAVAKAPDGKEREYMRFSEDKWILKTENEAAREKAKTDTVDLLRLGDVAAAPTSSTANSGAARPTARSAWCSATSTFSRRAASAPPAINRATRASFTKPRSKASRCSRSSTSPHCVSTRCAARA